MRFHYRNVSTKVANQFPLQGLGGLTDADGNIAQHVEYIPYGEVFVEERNSQFSTNFLFNAKELDNETGLYYYGARYLDPTGAMWLSVDPVFHAGTSPYAYCLGNPVKMVDPDGRDEKENGQYDKRQTLSEQETGFGSYNNIVGAVFGGASAEPAKGFCSASDLKAAEINIKNAKNGSGLTVESCMGKEGAKYYHMSASASKGVRVVGKAAMGMGVISMGATIGCAVSDVVDHCSSNLSDDDLILSNWTTLMSAAGSIAGGYGGTALGFAAGAETGPGALVTAAIGGYLGAEVGEKIGYGLGYALGKAHIFVRNNQNIINRAFNATKTENSFYFK
ncbi:MAG: hypothetical protein J6Y11_03290 [Paludibacteraceae bacterium]|nr:hypothetical protein [Paludibacteraceae bacterium]